MGRDYQREKKTLWEKFNEVPKKKKIPIITIIAAALGIIVFVLVFGLCNSKIEDKILTLTIDNKILIPDEKYEFPLGDYVLHISASPASSCEKILVELQQPEGTIRKEYTSFDCDLSDVKIALNKGSGYYNFRVDALYSDGFFIGGKKATYPDNYSIRVLPETLEPAIEDKRLTVTDQVSLREIHPSELTPIKAGTSLYIAAAPNDDVTAIYYKLDNWEKPKIKERSTTRLTVPENATPNEVYIVSLNVLYKDGLFLDGNAEVSSGYLVYEFVIVE